MNEKLRQYIDEVGEARVFVPQYHEDSCGAPIELPEEDNSQVFFSDYLGWCEKKADGTLRHLVARGRRLS